MGKALCEAHPALKHVYDEASSILGYDSPSLCFDGPAERLNLTEYTQPALLVCSIAAFKTLEPAGSNRSQWRVTVWVSIPRWWRPAACRFEMPSGSCKNVGAICLKRWRRNGPGRRALGLTPIS